MKFLQSARAAQLSLTAIAVLWGSTLVLTKGLLTRMPAPDLMAWRYLLAALTLVIIAPRALRMSRRTLRHGLILGAIFAASQALQTLGLNTTGAALSGFLTGLYLVATPLLGWLVYRARPGRIVWVAVAVGSVGLALLTVLPGATTGWTWGAGLTLIGAVGFGAHIVVASRLVEPGSTLSLTLVQTMVVGIVGLGWALPGGVAMPASPSDWAVLGYLGVLCGALTMLVQMWAQCQIEPTRAAVIMVSEPLWAAVFAVTLSDERMTWTLACGGLAMIVAGLLVVVPARTWLRARRSLTRLSGIGVPLPQR